MSERSTLELANETILALSARVAELETENNKAIQLASDYLSRAAELEARVANLEEAIQWYADKNNFEYDRGTRARAVLAQATDNAQSPMEIAK